MTYISHDPQPMWNSLKNQLIFTFDSCRDSEHLSIDFVINCHERMDQMRKSWLIMFLSINVFTPFFFIPKTRDPVSSTADRRLLIEELDPNVLYTIKITTVNDYGTADELVGCEESILEITTGIYIIILSYDVHTCTKVGDVFRELNQLLLLLLHILPPPPPPPDQHHHHGRQKVPRRQSIGGASDCLWTMTCPSNALCTQNHLTQLLHVLLLLGRHIQDRIHNAMPSISVRHKCLHICYLMPNISCNAVNVIQCLWLGRQSQGNHIRYYLILACKQWPGKHVLLQATI